MAREEFTNHLVGGFHRYSVDERWLFRTLKKMLYDQAMISSVLVEAYQLYGEEEWREPPVKL